MEGYSETQKIKILYEESLKDIREIVTRIETVGNALGEVAATLKRHETSAVSETAQQLNKSVVAIQQSVQQIAGVQDGIEKSTKGQAKALLAPLIGTLSDVLTSLKAKDGLALEHLKRTQATQARWATNAGLVIGGVVITVLIVGAGSYFTGLTLAQKEIAKTAEWLDSDEGKYAIQLKNAGSLKVLATCDPGNVGNNWKKSKDGKDCYPNLSDGKIIGWHITN